MSTLELLQQVKQLPPCEQLLFAEQILAGLVHQMPAKQSPKPLKSLLGLWQGFTVTEEDIAEARREMWGNFGERDF
jgi:hypothetical protein